jgi:hypothetical protein
VAARELLAAVKELALVVRTRLEDAAEPDRAAIEALIILQKTVEDSESGEYEGATRMLRLASEALLEMPLTADARELLELWASRLPGVEQG